MTDYEEFDAQLRHWLAEDAAAAHAASDLPCCEPLGWRAADRWSHRPRGLVTRDDTGGRAITLLTPDYPDSIDSGVDLIRAEDGGIPLNVADHIVTWDPARVLADLAGKVALLDHVAAWPHVYTEDSWYSCSQAIGEHDEDEVPGSGCADEDRKGKPCDCGLDGRRIAVLKCVAAGYVERPEFKAEWRLA